MLEKIKMHEEKKLKKEMQRGHQFFYDGISLNVGERPRPCNWNGIESPREPPD
jgi:hypothetical protein